MLTCLQSNLTFSASTLFTIKHVPHLMVDMFMSQQAERGGRPVYQLI